MTTRIHDCATSKPFVSVVIPCFNNVSTLKTCLQALEQQSYPPACYEIIVSDNGSTDGSIEYVTQQHPRIRLVHATRRGSAYARNQGFAVAQGVFILSTDADCVPDHQWMERLVSVMQAEDSGVAAVGGAIAPFSLRTRAETYHKAWVSQPRKGADKVRYTATPNAIFRADAVRAVQGFDGLAGHDDTDLGIRLTAAGHRIVYTDAATVLHRNPVTLRELYHHRRKYGQANYTLARKHTVLFGDPSGPTPRRKLLLETVRRVLSDAVKFPFSFFRSRYGHPRGWPLTDAVMAVGNYVGFARASKAATHAS